MRKTWMELYPKNVKPNIVDIENYLQPIYFKFYKQYVTFLEQELDLTYFHMKFNNKNGWVLMVGKSALIMIKNIVFSDQSLFIEDVKIEDKNVLQELIVKTRMVYSVTKRFSINRTPKSINASF